jgi:hypothetical protein
MQNVPPKPWLSVFKTARRHISEAGNLKMCVLEITFTIQHPDGGIREYWYSCDMPLSIQELTIMSPAPYNTKQSNFPLKVTKPLEDKHMLNEGTTT